MNWGHGENVISFLLEFEEEDYEERHELVMKVRKRIIKNI